MLSVKIYQTVVNNGMEYNLFIKCYTEYRSLMHAKKKSILMKENILFR